MEKQGENSLQAVLDRKRSEEANQSAARSAATRPVGNKLKPKRHPTDMGERASKLIGGHFPLPVARQLAIIAAEEGATKQGLLAEALDLLFVKKGKSRISEL